MKNSEEITFPKFSKKFNLHHWNDTLKCWFNEKGFLDIRRWEMDFMREAKVMVCNKPSSQVYLDESSAYPLHCAERRSRRKAPSVTFRWSTSFVDLCFGFFNNQAWHLLPSRENTRTSWIHLFFSFCVEMQSVNVMSKN